MQAETKNCQNCRKDFIIEPYDFNFYEKIKVPPPTWCRECRAIRRMLHRNEHTLYKRTCDLTGAPIISIFSKESGVLVCDQTFWRSDKFDAGKYSLSLDFSKSFFSQWYELSHIVPFPAVALELCVNSPFNHYCTNLRDCYYCFRSHRSVNAFYTYNSRNLENCVDCYDVNFSNLLYECVDTHNSELSSFLEICDHISRSHFLYNCKNCVDCFMSSNLSNKQYYFRNEKLPREEYLNLIKTVDFSSSKIMDELLSEFYKLKQNTIQRGNPNINTIGSSGLCLRECKNVHDSFYAKECENIRFGYYSNRFKDSYDIYAGSGNELTYETAGVGHSSDIMFSSQTTESVDVSYTIYADYCKHLFGCIGLQNKEYCILNKQYTKEEYEELVPKIIKHMNDMPYVDGKGITYRYGEFFPPEISFFAYNETIAQDYFPLTEEEIIYKGYRWVDQEEKNYKLTLDIKDIPDKIQSVPESITEDALPCEDHINNRHVYGCGSHCSTAFRITKRELGLYKRMNVPLPLKCPQCRFYRRLRTRNFLQIYKRKCMCDKNNHHNHKEKCKEIFESAYSPDRPEIVYCEKCYQQEVY